MKAWRKEANQRRAAKSIVNASLTQPGVTIEQALDKLPSRLGRITKRFITNGQQYRKYPSALLLSLLKRV